MTMENPLPTGHNMPEYSVTELSLALKSSVEERFSQVRVKGEISGFKRHSSGHLYFCLKDMDSVLDAVCWRGQAARLEIAPEDGLEVIATGRLTTYPSRSKYQIVVERMELAGQGALLKLLEERRKKLAQEGLFDAERKSPLPFSAQGDWRHHLPHRRGDPRYFTPYPRAFPNARSFMAGCRARRWRGSANRRRYSWLQCSSSIGRPDPAPRCTDRRPRRRQSGRFMGLQ